VTKEKRSYKCYTRLLMSKNTFPLSFILIKIRKSVSSKYFNLKWGITSCSCLSHKYPRRLKRLSSQTLLQFLPNRQWQKKRKFYNFGSSQRSGLPAKEEFWSWKESKRLVYQILTGVLSVLIILKTLQSLTF